jgi:hypothetical protein
MDPIHHIKVHYISNLQRLELKINRFSLLRFSHDDLVKAIKGEEYSIIDFGSGHDIQAMLVDIR